MKCSDLFEDIKGEVMYDIPYHRLYHMTDSKGLSYIVSNDCIQGKTQDYISTTFNPEMSRILGRYHAYFKFTLNGKKLIRRYGGFTYDFHATEIGNGSGHRQVSLEEDEIGINTPKITNANEYILALDIMLDIYSELGIINLCKFDSRTIFYILNLFDYWNIPITVRGKKISDSDVNYLRKMNKVVRKLGRSSSLIDENDKRTMRIISMLIKHYKITDIDNVTIDQMYVKRKQHAQSIMDDINRVLTTVKVRDIDENKLRSIVIKWVKRLGYGEEIINALEKNKLFSRYIEPVKWSTIFKGLLINDMNQFQYAVSAYGEDLRRMLIWKQKELEDSYEWADHYKHAISSL